MSSTSPTPETSSEQTTSQDVDSITSNHNSELQTQQNATDEPQPLSLRGKSDLSHAPTTYNEPPFDATATTMTDYSGELGQEESLSSNPWSNSTSMGSAGRAGHIEPRAVTSSNQDPTLLDGSAQHMSEKSTEHENSWSPTPPPPPPKDEKFLPMSPSDADAPPARNDMGSSSAALTQPWTEAKAPEKVLALDTNFDAKQENDEVTSDSKSEIQSIMEQFEDGQGDQSLDDVMSPRLHKTGTNLSVFEYTPRKSSLENLSRLASEGQAGLNTGPEAVTGHAREGSASSTGTRDVEKVSVSYASQPLPPEPDPEPDLPFDFHRFLEQLRHRTADPVARFLRSFLLEFGKKQWMVHEQVKIISDFLLFIGNRMAQCEVWRNVSEAEFDNAKEGMEKLVMNRLYTQTFSPEIPPPEPVASKARRKASSSALGLGRKGQHQEDVERDDVLAQKVRIYGWIREEHLDVKPFSEKGRKFLRLAQQELSKIKAYRAPRDKVICVLNSCKVIFGFLRNAQTDQSADSFIPLLIYTVLKANPDHLVSNLQYILRFRNQDKLGGEAGYYISSLMGAVQFIENLDRTNLTISDEDFEREVEASVSAIAERQSPNEKPGTVPFSSPPMHFPEKSTLSRPEVTPRNSMDAEQSSPRRGGGGSSTAAASEDSEENIAVAGLLRSIQKPLSTIGRIFSDDSSATAQARSAAGSPHQPALTPLPGSTPSGTPPILGQTARGGASENSRPQSGSTAKPLPPGAQRNVHVFEPGNALLPPGYQQSQDQPQPPRPSDDESEMRARMDAEEAAARQASAEAAEAHRVERAEHATVVETLKGMFPNLDIDIISDVVREKKGRVGLAVDACLALSH